MSKTEKLNKEIKQLEKVIRDQKEIISANNPMNAFAPLLDSIAGIHWSKDKNGKYLSCNNLMVKTLGLNDKNDIVGKTDYELPWADQADMLVQNDLEVMKDAKVQKAKEELVQTPDGVTHTFMVTKCPLKNHNGKIIGTFGCSVDITHIKALEKELRIANQAKSKFIANMSHDIRTPLTGIVGLSEILMDSVVKPESREYAKLLHLSGKQLLSLLNDILDVVATNQTDESQVNLSAFSIYEFLHNLFELQLPALKLKDIQLQLKLDDNLPSFIETDKGKLYRILLNLLSNSIKFTEKGLITLEVKCTPMDDNQSQITIILTDTGIGIPKKDMDKIFNSFYRVHPSYEGNYSGHGVGLHLVKQFLALLKGKIEVKSIEGMGTQFQLTLPVNVSKEKLDTPSPAQPDSLHRVIESINGATQETEIKKSESIPEAPINKEGIKILLVEDNLMAMQVAYIMLTKKGVITKKAYNGKEALKVLEEDDFDLIISDIGLPDFSGFELARQVKARNLSTPIVGLTAHAKEEALPEAQQSGMADVYEKPMTAHMIEELINGFSKNKLSTPDTEPSKDPLPLFDVELSISQLGSKKDLKMMIGIMLKEGMVHMVNEINQDYQNKDWSAFKKSAHKFKSSCLYCATTRLLKYAQELEALSESQNLKKITPVYEAFQVCVKETKQELNNWLLENSQSGD